MIYCKKLLYSTFSYVMRHGVDNTRNLFRTRRDSYDADGSFADNRPKALVQMATGAGKTFTAITAAYRLLKYGKMNRILFLVDTKSLGEQTEREFFAYRPTTITAPSPGFTVCTG